MGILGIQNPLIDTWDHQNALVGNCRWHKTALLHQQHSLCVIIFLTRDPWINQQATNLQQQRGRLQFLSGVSSHELHELEQDTSTTVYFTVYMIFDIYTYWVEHCCFHRTSETKNVIENDVIAIIIHNVNFMLRFMWTHNNVVQWLKYHSISRKKSPDFTSKKKKIFMVQFQ